MSDRYSTADRILWNRRPTARNGDDIDEIVVSDCWVHIEQMDDRCWWIGITKGDQRWCGNFTADSRGRMTFWEQENGINWDEDATHEWVEP